eukprot:12550489-Alexandrium_andersonii.AAC.1
MTNDRPPHHGIPIARTPGSPESQLHHSPSPLGGRQRWAPSPARSGFRRGARGRAGSAQRKPCLLYTSPSPRD